MRIVKDVTETRNVIPGLEFKSWSTKCPNFCFFLAIYIQQVNITTHQIVYFGKR